MSDLPYRTACHQRFHSLLTDAINARFGDELVSLSGAQPPSRAARTDFDCQVQPDSNKVRIVMPAILMDETAQTFLELAVSNAATLSGLGFASRTAKLDQVAFMMQLDLAPTGETMRA